jgi:hypothetical protein
MTDKRKKRIRELAEKLDVSRRSAANLLDTGRPREVREPPPQVKKRKQHYVWKHYLKAWATKGRVWCHRAGKCFPASIEDVANRRDFYRLREMSAYDISIVQGLISRMAEHLQDLARGWIPHFSIFHEVKREYEATGQTNRELEEYLDVAINNLEEDLHAGVESKAVPILNALRRGDSSFLQNDERSLDFARFVGMQYMRTPGIMRRATEVPTSGIRDFNIEASWGLIRTILATNLGGSLYARRRASRLTFLDAPPELELITGDQPIVNARGGGRAIETPPTELEFYYPLTPTRALLMSFDPTSATAERRALTMDETATYNRMIVSASDEQVYARSEAALVAASPGVAPQVACR